MMSSKNETLKENLEEIKISEHQLEVKKTDLTKSKS